MSLSPEDLVKQREMWLRERRKGIGSSDVAAVLGMSPWVDCSPLSVYLDKRGLLPAKRGKQLEWGHRHEPTIAAYYSDATGRQLRQGELISHPETPWLMCTPDRDVVGERRLVELKANEFHGPDDWGEEGTDQIPPVYICQTQHQMHVSQVPVADVCVMLGLFECRIYTVHYSPEFYALIFPILRDFWELVQRGVPPEPDWTHPATPALVQHLHRPVEGQATDLGEEAAHWVREYVSLGEALHRHERERELAKARIVEAMGGASVGRLPDGSEVLRTVCQRKGYSVDPGEYVRMTVRQPRRRKGGGD